MTAILEGHVYVLKNAGLPGLLKIGRTIREVGLRKGELWKEYGTLEPFVEVSRHVVSDCVAVETLVHRKLKSRRGPKTELFKISEKRARAVIMWAAREVLGRPWYVNWWRSLIAPRPEARARTLAKGRGTYRRHSRWPLALVAGAALIIAGLVHFQPEIPDWLPGAMQRACLRLEGL